MLIASGVLAHNGIASASVELAFDYRSMVIVYPQAETPRSALERLEALTTQFAGLPGVAGVTTSLTPPLSGRSLMDIVPGAPRLLRNAVAPSYFGLMGLPIVRGRGFEPGRPEPGDRQRVRGAGLWPNQDPLGKPVQSGGSGPKRGWRGEG